MQVLATLATVTLVWLVAAGASAAFVSAVWRAVQPRIASWHWIDAGRIALGLATAPVVLPSALALLLLWPGLAGVLLPALDHCGLHPDHAHLCLVHPSAAMPLSVALAVLASSAVALLAAWRAWRKPSLERARLWRLGAGPQIAPGVELVDSERPFAFSFGLLRTRALVSTGLVHALRPDQVAAVLAHEAEHVWRRDPLRQLVAQLASLPVWPPVRRELLACLSVCAERACDERAAREGDRVLVAETILSVERLLGATRLEPSTVAPGIAAGPLTLRVQALLREPPRRRRGWGLLACGAALLVSLAGGAVHHELEHLLALIAEV